MGSKNTKEKEVETDANGKMKISSIKGFKLTNDLLVSQINRDPEKDYNKSKKLGEGSFGSVYLVTHKITKFQRAMKELCKSKGFSDKMDDDILNEINMLKSLDNPSILKIFEIYSTRQAYYLVTELCSKGDLFDEINNKGPFNETITAFMMYQLFSAINYCHKMKIIHRDLKPENVFIYSRDENNYPILKIGDFGTAAMFSKDQPLHLLVGSGYYIAPEVLKKNYNEKCDIWSLGVIMYILLSGRPPFGGNTFDQISANIMKGVYDLKSSPFDKISKEAKDLICSLLCRDPSKRISAEDALKSDWFTKNKSKELLLKVSNKNIIQNFIDNIKHYKRTSVLQETALAYLVHNFSQRDDIEDAFKLFRSMDTSGDGKILKAELTKGLKEYVSANELENDVNAIFSSIDADNNGYIQYEEFVRAAMPKELFLQEKFLKFAFQYFDRDNSGTIDFEEIKKIFINSINKEEDADKILKKIISEVDTDNSGNISYDEFCEVMVQMVGEKN